MMEFSISRMIFSSTAAVYGSPRDKFLVEESDETIPITPYGASKLAAEKEVTKFLKQSGNSGTSLRFFNVIGTAKRELKDNSVDNLVPIILDSLKKKVPPVIFGTDYPTTDGTCIRDYVDVRDVAKAHFLVASHEGPLPYALNVGTGKGHSVREVISQIIQEAGYSNVEVMEKSRREGDPASLCADTSKFQEIMKENLEFTLRDSVSSLLQ
jgi:UDP-glucose 4-epimerase